MIKHNMKPIFKYLCIPALITLPVSSACADDDTDLFINKVINIYQHPDRKLVITWTDDSNKSPSDGSPIRNADVVNFHSKCKMLGGVAEFFSEAFLCRFPPEDLPRPVVYPVHSLPV